MADCLADIQLVVAILTGPEEPMLRAAHGSGRVGGRGCDPHRPRRADAAFATGPAGCYRMVRELRSSPAPKSRCCQFPEAALQTVIRELRSSPAPKSRCCVQRQDQVGALRLGVAILTGPEEPMLRFTNWDVGLS